jgi:flagellar hook-associated protein 2
MTTSSVSSSTTGTLSSLGLGSGLDSNGIVSKLVQLERAPITQLQNQADKIQTKVSAFAQVQSSVTSFRDAARKIADPTFWGAMTATSTDSAAVSFSTSNGAAAGSYSVEVSALAKAQNVVMAKSTSAATNTIGSGTLSFQTGTWKNGAFDGGTAATVDVGISATDTLENIRDKVNNAGAGVSASIIVDSSGARLAFTSTASGAANGFRVQVQDGSDTSNTDAAGLSMLAYDPENNSEGTDLAQSAQDSSVKVNGVPLTSTTNTFTTALSNISFTVGKVTTSGNPATVTVAQDKDTIAKAITDFATAYTSLSDLLHADTKYDDSSKTSGPLQGDATAVSILNQFRSALGSGTSASSVYGTLSAVGLSISSTGGLTVDSAKLSTALGKMSEVKKLFTAAGTGNGDDGIATRLRSLGDNMLSFDGTLASRTAGLNKLLAANQSRQDDMDARATLYENRLRKQYTALDTTMAGISSQSQYVTQMITAWNKG